jgi:hypothetical protein
MSEKFDLIDKRGQVNGFLHIRYGLGPDDPLPFVLTLTPQYVARALGKTPPVTFAEIEKYADRNATDLRAKAAFEKDRGFTTHTLD